jgi:subtilase family serine protease
MSTFQAFRRPQPVHLAAALSLPAVALALACLASPARGAVSTADITSLKGITIGGAIGGVGGKFAPWGGTIVLTEADAFLKSNGQCAFNVAYDMANAGTAATPAQFKNYIYAKDKVVAINSGLSLNAGEIKQVFTQPYLPQGTYAVRLSLDAENSVIESNDSNNAFIVVVKFEGGCGGSTTTTTTATPAPKADLVNTKGITIGGAIGGAGGKTVAPGGSVKLASSDAFLMSNGKCAFNISYTMENTGTAAASPSFVNRISNGPNVISQQSGLSLEAGKTKTVNTQAYLSPGASTLRLALDADNAVAESNEANNITEYKVQLDSTCGLSSTTRK